MNPAEKTELDKALEWARADTRFGVILGHIASIREESISALGNYETDAAMRKAAAEVTVWTEVLDLFGVPMGTPIQKDQEA